MLVQSSKLILNRSQNFGRENLAPFHVYNSIIPRIKNAKFSGYCFYLNTNLYGDLQICINVPLIFTSKI